jgi:hypothetical protein
MLPNQTQLNTIEEYFCSVLQRYATMERNGVDTVGLTKAIQMAERYTSTGTITPGEFQYLYDRTHPKGKLKDYNQRGKKYGLMMECPVELLVKYAVDWHIPATPLKATLRLQHKNFDDWYHNAIHTHRYQNGPQLVDLSKL